MRTHIVVVGFSARGLLHLCCACVCEVGEARLVVSFCIKALLRLYYGSIKAIKPSKPPKRKPARLAKRELACRSSACLRSASMICGLV